MSVFSNKKTVIFNIAVTVVLMAMNVAMSSFSVPVPGGHLYLNDVVICLASILLGPVEAFMVGGVGAFLGDLFFYWIKVLSTRSIGLGTFISDFFYPTPMFVSLVTHGLQAVIISLFVHKFMKNKPHLGSIIGVAVGAVIMVVGYSLGRAFIYSTPEYAIVKLPFQILQAVFGAVLGTVFAWRCGLRKLYLRLVAGK